jgi:signal transduction histidine kinase
VDQILSESIQKFRRLSRDLSPAVLHHSGLVDALNWLARTMEKSHGLKVNVDTEGWHELSNEPLRTFLFRAGDLVGWFLELENTG